MNYGGSDVIDYLSPNAWKSLQAFITQATPSALRRRDWLVFYDFVRSCHTHQVLLSKESLLRFLRDNGFPDTLANELGNVYLHGRGLLAAGALSRAENIGI